MEFFLKAAIAGVIIASVSYLSEKNITLASLLMGIPLTAFISMIFMNYNGITPEQFSQFSRETVIFVLTSLIFFVIFSFVIYKFQFWWSMAISFVITTVCFQIVMFVLNHIKG